MTNPMRFFVNSYWSSTDMKPTSTPMSMLTHELEVRSCGSPGRDLVERLETYRLDLMGASSAFDFALLMQSREPAVRQVLAELLEWTALDGDFLLISLVALSPELEIMASRLCRGRPSDDTVSELLTQATVALRWTHELVDEERIGFVLSQSFTRARAEQRKMAWHNVPTTRISDDYDKAEPETEPVGVSAILLSRAVERNIVSNDEWSLIQSTRGVQRSVESLVGESSDTYQALRRRRIRAEAKIRRYLYAGGDAR